MVPASSGLDDQMCAFRDGSKKANRNTAWPVGVQLTIDPTLRFRVRPKTSRASALLNVFKVLSGPQV